MFKCPLCSHDKTLRIEKNTEREFYQCLNCQLIFVSPHFHLSYEEESKRYGYHQNDPKDSGYRNFLKILLTPLKLYFPHQKCCGLDYGSGNGGAVSVILGEEGHAVVNYDPLFYPSKENWPKKFDFVTCTEVIEHFSNPKKEWEKLIEVSSGALLGIMSHLTTSQLNFSSWYYKNDPTHIAFYNRATLQYIADVYSLKLLEVADRYAIFQVP